jgi:hypothetical protein
LATIRLPLGFTLQKVEKRGHCTKKRIVVDPVEAEIIRLMFDHIAALAPRGKPPYGRGVLFGRPTERAPHQRRVADDETLTDIARSYNINHSTISRLR